MLIVCDVDVALSVVDSTFVDVIVGTLVVVSVVAPPVVIAIGDGVVEPAVVVLLAAVVDGTLAVLLGKLLDVDPTVVG